MNNDLINCLILVNGDIDEDLLKNFISQNSPRKSFLFISADGASDTLLKYNITPDYIIGDLDSISQKSIRFFNSKGTTVKKIYDQEHNDLDKCINFALKQGCGNIDILGYGGKRIDHTLNNFSILKKYSKKCNIRFYDGVFESYFLEKKVSINYIKNEPVSLIALPNAKGIKTTGLKYKLYNETLSFGNREGALNLSTSKTINIEFQSGFLMIVKKHFGHLKFSL